MMGAGEINACFAIVLFLVAFFQKMTDRDWSWMGFLTLFNLIVWTGLQ